MKPSLDVNSIKEFCTDHVEKFVFGGVVLLLLIFAVRAVGTIQNAGPGFEPQDLESDAEAAREHWQQTEPSVVEAKFPIVPYDLEARDILNPVPPDPYQLGVPFRRPIAPPLAKRDAPQLAAIEDVRAAAGNGAVQSMNRGRGGGAGDQMAPMGGARNVVGRRWVVVTALIPARRNREAYEKVFQDAALRRRTDVPLYLGYRIKRAEVRSDDDSELQWEHIKEINLLEAFRAAGYRGGSRQVVDRRYFPPAAPGAKIPMVFPLPPLVNDTWGPEVAHYPEIKMLVDMPRSERGMYGRQPGVEPEEGEETEGAPSETEQPDLFEGPAGRGGRGGRGMMGGPGVAGPGMYGSGEEMYGGGGPGMMSMPGSEMMGSQEGYMGDSMYGSMPGSYDGYGPGEGRMRTRGPKPVEYQLFRFFDFQVEPGKRYRYRVQAVLLNPNYQVEKRYLLEENLAEKYAINAPWSEPSDDVVVPYDSHLLAGPVKAPATILYEPSADVVALTLRMEDGFQAAHDFTVYRGHLADFEAEIEDKKTRSPYGMEGYGSMEEGVDAGSSMMMEMMPGGGMEEPSRRRRNDDEEEPETIVHATRMLVLDMMGGEKLHRSDSDLTEPGKLLLMGPDGSLVVRRELEDKEEYLKHHVEEEKKPRRRERERPGAYGPGMEGSYEGMMMEDMYGFGSGEEDDRGNRRRGRGRRSRR